MANTSTPLNVKTFASLFSGGGLADIGAQQAGLQPIWAMEKDPKIAEVYAANLGDHVLTKSVSEVKPSSLQKPDVLWISPPCQAYSIARNTTKSKRDDADVGLDSILYISVLKPQWVFLENVEGYRRSSTFQAIVDALHCCGYWTNWSVLNAADFGVPQTRRRLILRAVKLASSDSVFLSELPPKQKWVGWYEAIADLIPSLPESSFAPWQIKKIPTLNSTTLVDSAKNPRDATIRGADQPSFTITAAYRPSHSPRAFIVSGTPNERNSKISIREKDEPCLTITSSYSQHPLKAQCDRIVAMTPRALARFQSVPDSYQLPDSRTLASKIIGNGVPCLMAKTLLEKTTA